MPVAPAGGTRRHSGPRVDPRLHSQPLLVRGRPVRSASRGVHAPRSGPPLGPVPDYRSSEPLLALVPARMNKSQFAGPRRLKDSPATLAFRGYPVPAWARIRPSTKSSRAERCCSSRAVEPQSCFAPAKRRVSAAAWSSLQHSSAAASRPSASHLSREQHSGSTL